MSSYFFFFSSRRRHTRCSRDWSSDVCSSDLSAAAYGMLGWKGPHSKQDGYRHRAEAEARVADPEAVVTILERLGFTVSLRIERRVEVWRLGDAVLRLETDRKSTRLNSSHGYISYAVFCLKKKKKEGKR